ncbi:phage tail protein, partial [Lactobacillus crispatus]|uniref:phage tail-collar fiber domain-containing protein n=1 Tax=Lactobacillus crispatus TaxID=47770 RepID=UPI0029C1F518
MGQFNATVLTHNGLDLLTRAQAGQVRIQFTRIGIGDGYPPADLRDLLSLVHEIKSLPILDIKLSGNGQTQIKAVFDNVGISTGVYFREIGLFANDPVKG